MRVVVSRSIAVVCAPLLFAGCYTYTAIDIASATPGMEVRARLSAPTAAQLAPSLGMGDARLLTGSVVDNQADGLTMRVPSAPVGTVGANEGLFQQILISKRDVLELESKQLDRTRTRVVIGASVVGAALAVAAVLHGGHSSGDAAVVEPPANFTIGIFGFRLGHSAPNHGNRPGGR